MVRIGRWLTVGRVRRVWVVVGLLAVFASVAAACSTEDDLAKGVLGDVAPSSTPTTVSTTTTAEDTTSTTAETSSTEALAQTTTTLLDRPTDPVPDLLADLWTRYRGLTEARDGDRTAALISEDTFEWYREVLELALTADEATLLEDTRLSKAMMVVEVRAAFGAELVSFRDGRDLFIARTDAGLTFEELTVEEFDRFSVASGHAFGLWRGSEAMRFELVDEQWLLTPSHWHIELFDLNVLSDGDIAEIFSDGQARTRRSFFDYWAGLFGESWEEIAVPIGTP